MADRAGVVSVDVEPNLQQVGSQVSSYASALKPFGLKFKLLDDFAGTIDQDSRKAQRSLDSISTSKAQGELRRLGTVGSQEVDRIGGKVRLTGSQLALVGSGAALVGAKMVKSLGPAVDEASALNETLSYSTVLFGEQADDIERFGERAAKALGLSKREAIDGANDFAGYAKAAGKAGDEVSDFSKDLVGLAADLGSAKGTSTQDAITAISSALRGEFDPIERYNVLLNDMVVRQEAVRLGITETTKDALQPQQRVLAVQSLLFEKTTDAQGDFARTAGSAANSAKTLNANLSNAKADEGKGLLGIVSATNRAVSELTELVGPSGTAVIGYGLAIGGTASIIGGLVTNVFAAKRALKDFRAERRALAAEKLPPQETQPVATRTFGPFIEEATVAATQTERVAASMGHVAEAATIAGTAGGAAMSTIATSATAAEAPVVGVGTGLARIGSTNLTPVVAQVAALRTEAQLLQSTVQGVGVGRGSFIDVDSWEEGVDASRELGTGAEAAGTKVRGLGGDADVAGGKVRRFGAKGAEGINLLGGAMKGLALVGLTDFAFNIGNQIDQTDAKVSRALTHLVASLGGASNDTLAAFRKLAEAKGDARDWSQAVTDITDNYVKLAGVGNRRPVSQFKSAFDDLLGSKGPEVAQQLIDATKALNAELPKTSDNYRATADLINHHLQPAVDDATKAQENQAKASKKGSDAVSKFGSDVDVAGSKVDRFGFIIDENKGKAEQWADSLSQALDPFQAALDADANLESAHQRVTDAEAEVQRIRGQGAAGQEEEAKRANDLATAIESVAEARRSEASAARDAADAKRDREGFEAELAHVDPLRDPNRFRELAEKVRDAKDAEQDANDSYLSAVDSRKQAERDLGDTRAEQVSKTDDLAQAERDLESARRDEVAAAEDKYTADAKLRDEIEKHPQAIKGTFAAIDEWVRKGWISTATAKAWKEEVLHLVDANKDLNDILGSQPQAGIPVPAGAPGRRNADRENQAHGAAPQPSTNPDDYDIVTYNGFPELVPKAKKPATTTANNRTSVDFVKAFPADPSDGQRFSIGGQNFVFSNTAVGGPDWVGGDKQEALKRYIATGRLAGGDIEPHRMYELNEDGRPEMVTLGGRDFLATGDQSGQVTPYPKLGGQASPLRSTVTAEAVAPSSGGVALLERPTQLVDLGPVVERLDRLTAAVTNIENTTYAPTIHARPDQVERTMAEAFRASRRDAWENHGKWPN